MTIPTSRPANAARSATSPAAPSTPRRGDAIDLWLTMFSRFLRLPVEQGRAIRDELDAHMRERVRDLMLEGLSEDEGTRRAIDELGEAAELAAHFRAAHRSPWRLTMSIAALGVAASAAVVSIVALTQSGQPPAGPGPNPVSASARPADAGSPTATGAPILSDMPIVGTFFTQRDVSPVISSTRQPEQPGPRVNLPAGEHPLRKVLETIAAASGRRLVLSLPQGVDPTGPLSLELVESDVPGALRRVNRALDRNGVDRLDMRIRGEVIEIATVADFDKDETTLVAYDLSAAFQQGASQDGLSQTLTGFIEPESWRDNGGVTAKLMIVGKRLFVEAPPRHQEGVLWILNQFGGKPRVSVEQPGRFMLPRGGGPAGKAAGATDRQWQLERDAAIVKARLGVPLSPRETDLIGSMQVKGYQSQAEREDLQMDLHRLTVELNTLREDAMARGTGASNPLPPQQDRTLAYEATLRRVEELEREIALAKAAIGTETSESEKSKLVNRPGKAGDDSSSPQAAAKVRLESLIAELAAHRHRLPDSAQGQVRPAPGR